MHSTPHLEAIAIHEAGHCFISWLFGWIIGTVSIIPRTDCDGSVSFASAPHGTELAEHVAVSLGGPVAQSILENGERAPMRWKAWQYRDDERQVLLDFHRLRGYRPSHLYSETVFTDAMEYTSRVIHNGWPAVTALATTLHDRRILTGAEVSALFFQALERRNRKGSPQ